MSNTFYTSIEVSGNYILFRGFVDGKRIRRKIAYSPSLFIRTTKETPYRTILGEPLEELKFDRLWDARGFLKQHRDSNLKVYGNSNFAYAYIADHFADGVQYDINRVRIAYLDIEVGSEHGFPQPGDAIEPITAITVYLGGVYFAFGCGKFNSTALVAKGYDVRYFACSDERELVKAFLTLWNKHTPDVISGWSIEKFDIPYLVNRIKRLFPDATFKKLSPWWDDAYEPVKERKVYAINRQFQVYDLLGVATLDYFDLYKKYAPHPNQESHKLGDIAWVEIKEGKINYDEYGNLHTLYTRDFQRFMEYNIQDVALVYKINQKMRLIELAITMAYDNHINYSDVFSQVRMWDSIIYNHLRNQNIIIPPKPHNVIKVQFAGGYVKEPQPGLYGWGVSFDLDGLYPHLIMQYNLGPETLVEFKSLPHEVQKWFTANRHLVSVDGFLSGELDLSILKKHKLALAPNGVFFTTEFQGFLAKLMESYYADRKKYKKEMLKYDKLLEADKDNEEYKNLKSMYNNFQSAKKITINAAYGSLGNEFFRFFDVRIAEAVTLTGQLSVRWIANKVNVFLNEYFKTQGHDYIIASDTDSIYVSMESISWTKDRDLSWQEVSKLIDNFANTIIVPFIAECFDELADYVNAYAQKMSMKRENIYNRAIWTGKKRYFINVTNGEGGVAYENPQIKIKGNEAVRASTPAVVREALKETFDIIMNEDQAALRAFVRDFKAKFMKMTLQAVATPKACNDITSWVNRPVFHSNGIPSGCPHHVKGAIIYNTNILGMNLDKKYQLIKDGEKIKYIPLKLPNPVNCDVISFPMILPDELDLTNYLDYDSQFERAFISPLKIVLDAIGWSLQEQSNLDSLWG